MDWLRTDWEITFRLNGLWLGLILLCAALLLIGVPLAINTLWSWRYLRVRKATAEFARLTDALPVGVIVVAPDNRVLLTNRRSEELWPEIARGKQLPSELTRLRGPDDGFASALVSTPAKKRLVARVHGLLVPRGRELLISLEDATHLEEESELATTLLRQVTHELKTPLSVIRGHASRFAVAGSADAREAQRAWAVVDDEASRLTALIDQALLMARLETPNPLFERRPVNLRALCEEVVIDLADRAALQPAELDFEVEDGRFTLQGDRPALRQMLLNLVDNAMKYGGDGVRVTLALCRDIESGQIRLSVADDGPGITEVDLPLVFEKGYRGAHMRGSRVGTGLGLALVRAIVAWHGGVVSAESRPGGGASIVILLPDGTGQG
jgi:two-component system, OmpR family, phosphate regulon sensor histidine kinase PhoR